MMGKLVFVVVVLVALVALVQAEDFNLKPTSKDFACPRIDGDFKAGYHSNPSSCQTYFICDDRGVAYDGDCGEFGSFDPVSETCKLKDEVDCGTRSAEATNVKDEVKDESKEQKTTTEAPEPTTTTANERDEEDTTSAEAPIELTTSVPAEDGVKGEVKDTRKQTLLDYAYDYTGADYDGVYDDEVSSEPRIVQETLYSSSFCEGKPDGKHPYSEVIKAFICVIN